MNSTFRPSEFIDRKSSATFGIELTSVSVVVPCFNEEESIPQLAERLNALPAQLPSFRLTFVIVDDGSTDATWSSLVSTFADDPRFVLTRHRENKGIAAAIETGAHAAKDEILAVIDSDCTYDPLLIGEMVPLLTEDVQMVTASPYHKLGEVVGVVPWRLVLSQCASRLYRLLLRNKLATYTSCFRIYRRSALMAVPRSYNGFVGIAEVLARFDQMGWRIVEHPARLTTRAFGQSKLSVARAVTGHLRFLAWIAYARSTRQWG